MSPTLPMLVPKHVDKIKDATANTTLCDTEEDITKMASHTMYGLMTLILSIFGALSIFGGLLQEILKNSLAPVTHIVAVLILVYIGLTELYLQLES